jgi:hypothetical protein
MVAISEQMARVVHKLLIHVSIAKHYRKIKGIKY